MRCPHCGVPNPDGDARFCTSCDQLLDGVSSGRKWFFTAVYAVALVALVAVVLLGRSGSTGSSGNDSPSFQAGYQDGYSSGSSFGAGSNPTAELVCDADWPAVQTRFDQMQWNSGCVTGFAAGLYDASRRNGPN